MKEKRFDEMLDLICQHLNTLSAGETAYTMLLGAGFSYGVIPTAKEILIHAPIWLYNKLNKHTGKKKALADAEIIKNFWEQVKNNANDHDLEFNKDTGLPSGDYITKAYKHLMSTDCHNGLTTPVLRREYIRHLCKNADRNNNQAHVYLACLLNQQNRTEWGDRAKFCKTILTTNFDTLLQDALQLVNVLYYMSDRPEVLDNLQEDSHEATHLVYTHGSVHRYMLLNSEDEIRKWKINSSSIKSHFERHGVIVMGYGGWDDATREALSQANQFDGNLYWCVRKDDMISDEVLELLEKHSACAFKVEIPNADEAMKKIFKKLTNLKTPRFMTDPIEMIIEQMDGLSFTEPKNTECKSGEVISKPDFSDDFNSQIEKSIKRLRIAREAYENPEKYHSNGLTEELAGQKELGNIQAQAVASKYLQEARRLFKAGELMESIEVYSKVLNIHGALSSQKAEALINRAKTYGKLEPPKTEEEIADYTTVIEMPEASAEDKVMGILNRAFKYGELDPPKTKEEIADYTTVIEMADVSVDDKATAMHNRGLTYGKLDPPMIEEEIADYKAIIEITDVASEYKARALCNLACSYGNLDSAELDQKIKYYTSVIEDPCTLAVCKATALINRSIAYREFDPPRIEDEIADYTSVIAMKDVSSEQKAKALVYRAVVYTKLDPPKIEDAISDSTAVIEMSDVTDDIKSTAHGNMGIFNFQFNNDIQSLSRESLNALRYNSESYAWRYNLGLANLFLGKHKEVLEYCMPAIDDCPSGIQINDALDLLKIKTDILPKTSRGTYKKIVSRLKERKGEIKEAKN